MAMCTLYLHFRLPSESSLLKVYSLQVVVELQSVQPGGHGDRMLVGVGIRLRVVPIIAIKDVK